jgi:hypothetical protein
MTHKKELERWETKIGNTEVTPQAIWPIAKSLLRGMDQGHQLLFIVHQALNFIHQKKPTQLLTVWKLSSHHMDCVMKTMNGEWRLEFKLYWKT